MKANENQSQKNPQNKRPPWNKRKFLVNSSFQLQFLAFGISIGVLNIGVYSFFAYNYLRNFKNLGRMIDLPKNHLFYQFVREQSSQITTIFYYSGLTSLFLITVTSLYFSHRIAGPIYRLQKHLKGLSEGKVVSPLKFRKSDFFQQLANNFNQFIENIEQKAADNSNNVVDFQEARQVKREMQEQEQKDQNDKLKSA